MKKGRTFKIILLAALFWPVYALFGQASLQLSLTVQCTDGYVDFEVTNEGDTILPGDSIYYLVIEDQIIAREGTIDTLLPGDKYPVRLRAGTVSCRMELYQGIPSKDRRIEFLTAFCPDSGAVAAKSNRWWLGVQGGLLGPGIALGKQINAALTLRAGGTYLPFSFSYDSPYEYSSVAVDATASTASLLLDWFTGGQADSRFHLTIGGYYNLSSVEILIRAEEERLRRDGYELSQDEIGYLKLTSRPQPFNPYLGFGFGRLAPPERRVGAKLEFGVLYIGAPEIDFEATGAVAPTAEQEPIIEDNVKDYNWYPLINLIISYKL